LFDDFRKEPTLKKRKTESLSPVSFLLMGRKEISGKGEDHFHTQTGCLQTVWKVEEMPAAPPDTGSSPSEW
jgi:hypothetical protein